MKKYQAALNSIRAAINTETFAKELQDLQNLINRIQSSKVDAKETAINILKDFALYGEFYYTLEDWLVEQLTGHFTMLPIKIESEYLKCALRVEVRNLADNEDIELSDEDIENIVDKICDSKRIEPILNMDLIEDEYHEYINSEV